MKKLILILICSVMIGATTFAQVEEPTQVNDSTKVEEATQTQNQQQQSNPYVKKEKKSGLDKWYFGGNFTFTFGTYTSVGIWPLAAYKIIPKLSIGIQPGYEYLKYDDAYGGYETSNYGIRIFSRYRIIPQLYAHVEYASINYGYQVSATEEERHWVPFLFLGAGFSQNVGGRTSIYAQILFDVINDENSPYRSGEPFWTIGVAAGF